MASLRSFVERRYIVLFLVTRVVDCGGATADRIIERIANGDHCGAHDD